MSAEGEGSHWPFGPLTPPLLLSCPPPSPDLSWSVWTWRRPCGHGSEQVPRWNLMQISLEFFCFLLAAGFFFFLRVGPAPGLGALLPELLLLDPGLSEERYRVVPSSKVSPRVFSLVR